MKNNLVTTIFLLACLSSIISCQNYAVAYIFSNAIDQRLPNNSIRIYEKFRFESTVQMNSHTKQMYSNMDILKTLPQLNSQTLLKPEYQGTIRFEKTTLPQHLWIEDKQIVIIQVDISKFPQSKLELQKYSSLFKHKGTSFFMINSNQINETIPAQIGELFGFDGLKDTLCHINVQGNTLEENTQLIKKCYQEGIKKPVRGTIDVSFMYMVSQYGFMALVYVILTSLIACGSPYVMIWWHKRQDQKHSHV